MKLPVPPEFSTDRVTVLAQENFHDSSLTQSGFLEVVFYQKEWE